MGRKTWFEGVNFGIAPYKQNLNIIVSTTMRKENIQLADPADSERVFVVNSVEKAVHLVNENFSHLVETMIAIGGTKIFKDAVSMRMQNSKLIIL